MKDVFKDILMKENVIVIYTSDIFLCVNMELYIKNLVFVDHVVQKLLRIMKSFRSSISTPRTTTLS